MHSALLSMLSYSSGIEVIKLSNSVRWELISIKQVIKKCSALPLVLSFYS